MPTTHDDNATTWRDLADQLTSEQVRRFDHLESVVMDSRKRHLAAGAPYVSAEDLARGFLKDARSEAQQNLLDKMFDVAAPEGATSVEHWEDDGSGQWTRRVTASSRTIPVADATVYIDGVQQLDGTVTWSLYVHADDGRDLTTDQVRQFAAQLVEAADEMDRLR
jgi:hypothetical protein